MKFTICKKCGMRIVTEVASFAEVRRAAFNVDLCMCKDAQSNTVLDALRFLRGPSTPNPRGKIS